jgi:hypothetical protein
MSKDLVNKCSSNKLAMLEDTVKVIMEYSCESFKN